MKVELPFPSSKLSGHNTGHWRSKSGETAALRQIAKTKARASGYKPADSGDIVLRFTFTPPDNRGDRCNYYNRCKSIIDGIADGLGVNDKRFIPILDTASFLPPCKPGSVVVEVLG